MQIFMEENYHVGDWVVEPGLDNRALRGNGGDR